MSKRISQQRLESYLWGAAVLLRGTIDAGDYKQFIFPLLFYKRLCDVFDEETETALAESGGDLEFASYPENHRFQIPREAHWKHVRQATSNVGRAIRSAMRTIEKANPETLYGIFGDAQWTNKERLSDTMLRDLVEHFSTLDLSIANLPEDELGQGYEYLIKKFADDSGHTAAEFYTNRTVVHLMTEMLAPQPGESVYDPTCGSGGMLLSCIAHLRRKHQEWRNVRLYGQERNLMTSSFARMNCFLHGIEHFQIVRGDTLSDPKFVEGDRLKRFDLVLANPPYSIKQWDRDAFASDPWGRNLFGTPPQGRADYAFWQHIVCSLASKTGRCAILFPHGVLFRQEEAEMRQKLIEADLIECVLGLGPNLFYNSPMEACVVICRASKPKSSKGKILFINAVNEVTRDRGQSFLSGGHIKRIASAYRAFADEAGFAKVATLADVRFRNHSLSISLYIESTAGNARATVCKETSIVDALAAYLKSRAGVTATLGAVMSDLELPKLTAALKPAASASLLTDRTAWKRVCFGDVTENINETVSDQAMARIERFIGLEHLTPGSLHVRTWGNVSEGTTFTRRCRRGQVLFGKRRAYQRKVAVAEFDAVVSGDIYVLAAKADLATDFLPFICLSERFFQHAVGTSAGSLSPRTNWTSLAGFEFDLPATHEQQRISRVLWSIDELMCLQRAAISKMSAALAVKVDAFMSERWPDCMLHEALVYASDGPFGSKLKTEHYSAHGVRVIRLQNVGVGCFDDSDKAFISEKYFEDLRRYEVRPKDVIVAGLGDETHPVGRSTIVPDYVCPAVNKADCFCLRTKEDLLLGQFLVAFLNSSIGRERVTAIAQGTTRLRITISNQWTFQAGSVEKRFDIVFVVNGLPLVIGEAKTPTRSAVTWFDGAYQMNEIYEKQVPAMFVPNVFSFATEGKLYRYGSIRMPVDIWGPWRDEGNQEEGQLHHVRATVASMLRPEVVLDILQNFTLFATDKKHRRIKLMCRYQQYFTTNQIVDRVVKGYPKKGLIWHFQGSGKSLLMVFAAQKLRMHPKLGNPTVLIVVDRIDLDTQITATFNASDVPNLVGVDTRQELQTLLSQDVRKVLITTIHKFGEAEGKLNERSNIIVMVDEAHRTQEGDLGRKMRDALPNAFLFGLTGTPINRADRNTYWAFGADEDKKGYMSRYSFQDSIRDRATLPLHFEAPEVKLKIDRAAIDEAYKQITGNLSEQDRDDLAKRAAKMAVLVKNPERVRAVVTHIVKHYQTKVEPNGFKAQVVVFDRECCVLYKKVMDELIGTEASAVIMSAAQSDPSEWKEHVRDKDTEEKLLDRFRDPADPLKFVIVTSKLLTGFDAPVLQVMYLDKPMKDHNLLQAICRTNRTFGQEKTHGLIVDYIGIFDDVANALDFDEKAVQQVVSNLDELRRELPVQMQKCLAFFPGVDRSVGGYEGLMAAQQKLPNNEVRDKFAAEYSVLGRIWEALSPDPMLSPYEKDYRWLSQVYESVKPPSGNGKLLWHALGAKTIDLINQNVHLDSVRDDVETLVMDAQVLEEILAAADPAKKGKEIEIKLIARLRRHLGDPKFTALGERLERIKERHEQGFLTSLEFLKEMLELAKEVVEAEKGVDPVEERDRAKEALTELFNEAKNSNTHIIVERIVTDIDDIVKKVRFPEWQHTSQGERLVQKELRRTLLKYKLHTDQALFDKAYGYIRQYY